MGLLPGAEPFLSDGGPTGMLLSHGFTLGRAFDDLRTRCDRVFVGGLSMGGALALRLAEERPLYRSRVDHVVDQLSGRLLRGGASSTEVTEVILEDSYHVATPDNDAPLIFAGTVDFVRAHSPEAADSAG